MVYISGDTHGDFTRIEEFCHMYETSEEDVLIILGDAGINFYLNERDVELKEELYQLPLTLFCIHGNHEERPELVGSYEEKEWQGGLVYYEEDYPNILFAMDGEVYDFNGKKAIAIGGAYSVDKFYRLAGNIPWFSSEQPDDWIKARVERKLETLNWQVDHSTEEWLDTIEEKLDYKVWYFGHFHTDRFEGKATILYEDILELGE